MIVVQRYVNLAGVEVVTEWLQRLRDNRAHAKVSTRLLRLSLGNYGDHRMLGGGIGELRIDYGPGYRVYFAKLGSEVVLLLCGGDKSSQQRDIELAKFYLQEFFQRRANEKEAN